MALVLIYDTETTGFDVRTEYILEVGAAIYDTQIRKIVDIYSQFVLWSARPVSMPDALEIHGITSEMIERWGLPSEEVFPKLFKMADPCDFWVAHNAVGFDKPITESNILRIHDPSQTLKQKFYASKWIDSLIDIPYPKKIKQKSLEILALRHNYVLMNAHRALNDVFALAHVFSHYDYELIKEIASTPFHTIIADVSYQDRDKAKKEGFQWNPEKKQWEKYQRKYFTDKTASQLSFGIAISP